MKKSITVMALAFCISVVPYADTVEIYTSQFKSMFEHHDEWFQTFSEEAAQILLRERVSVRTMEILRASIGRDLLPEDASDAAATYCAVAREADALLRRGETPARVALQARVNMQRHNAANGSAPGNTGITKSSRSDMRSDRAKGAISAAKEKRSGTNPPGKGTK